MTDKRGLYPEYDVLVLQDEWDSLTKEIVRKRLGPFADCTTLSTWEQQMVKTIAQHLAYEDRDQILTWVVAHVDQQLTHPIGEGQRKPTIPPQKELVRDGLKALEKWAKQDFSKGFLDLETSHQFYILSTLQGGKLPKIGRWDQSLQKGLFKKLVGLVVDACYSHPWVWSEIGYGGPAYPRGYVRVELGITDPWEPKLADK